LDVTTAIKNSIFLSQQKLILVALSGGVDSMVLLHALHLAGIKIHAAHVHHGKRAESDDEEQFVKSWCKKHSISISIKRLNPAEKPENANFQDWARKERYAFFKSVAKKEGCQYIATAHHFDDKVETFLGHSLRGSGITGLSSLREKEGAIIRPLLHVSKATILHYAEENNLEWREDASNESDDYQRNRIRHYILPKLSEVKENWQAGLQTTFENIEAERELLGSLVSDWASKNTTQKGKELHINLFALTTSSAPKAMLYYLLYNVDAGFNWDALANATNDKVGSYYYGHSHRALRDRELLIISPIETDEIEEITISSSTVEVNQPIPIRFSVLHRDQQTDLKNGKANAEITFAPGDGLLDYEKLTFPLTLRKWQPGDKFIPLGMKGMKLISDYLSDNKIPRTQKEKTLVMVSKGRIVWLVGHRIDERFKVGAETQKMYLARLLNF
jgi:tRNA(Ile)-lysidine synthase